MKIVEIILGLIYPNTCPFCGAVTAERICGHCKKEITYIREPRCMKCGKPLAKEQQEYCYDCGRKEHYFERGYALWLHEKSVQHAIYQLKYHNRRIYGRVFGQELASQYGEVIRRWNISLIVPIPISKKRRKQRGFNQAEIIAKTLGKEVCLPVETKRFVRVKNTDPQKKMDVRGRKKNLKNAFAWKGKERISGNVLVIDDIYTTGNTIDSASRVLKQAGANSVFFLTISIGQGY